MSRRASAFQTIHSEGGLLPPDLLRRIVDPAARLPGTRPEDYGLPPGERLNEVIVQSWNRLQRHWADFQSATAGLAEGEAGTALTNDKWTLPLTRELGFGPLPTSVSPTIDDKTYAISRFSGGVPLHLIGRGLSLDRRKAGQKGAASSNPHGLVQEYLNRAPDAVWGIVSNGLELRILRDSQALSRQSYLAFDLQAMMAGAVYSDFVLLWMTAHATRFVPRDPNRPGSCWLEEWTQVAVEDGTRAFTDLRAGVEKALQILGEGFTSHPANTALRDALRTNQLTPRDLHYQLLRVVYRLLFLFVAEDRTLDHLPVLHPPGDTDADRAARDRYTRYYSTGRLRDLADRIKGSRHGDLWRQFQLIVGALSGDPKFSPLRESLALPVLGSLLWDPARTASLNGQGLAEKSGTELSNYDFLEALRHLAYIQQDGARRAVDFKNLGSDEFGGIYESLLSLTPQVIGDGSRFTFAEFAGNERKTSGSYYTPDSLVQCLLDSALEPVVDERLAGKTGAEAEKALLSLKVCDPAVGSGHFLVGAAHRLARRLARIRANMAGESEPSPRLYQHALRDVIGRCLYGVDINEMSAELCRVTLWLEAIEPGKPLSFLDHHILVGNSLLGTTPDLIKGGIPDEAYDAIGGDDKDACSALKKKNRRENPKLGELFIADEVAIRDRLYQAAAALDEMGDSRPEDIRRKEAAFRLAQQNDDFQKARDLANLWCAAFVIEKQFPGYTSVPPGREASPLNDSPTTIQAGLFGGTEEAPKAKGKKQKAPSRADAESAVGITTQHLRDFVHGCPLPDGLLAEAKLLADQYQFFHYHLMFPEAFAQGGFDVTLGNPPWEQLEQADGSVVVREMSGIQHFVQHSGRFPLCGRGRKNLYGLFCELVVGLRKPSGSIGIIVPTGLLQDDPANALAKDLFSKECIESIREFENRRKNYEGDKWFSAADPSMRFCLVTIRSASPETSFVFDVDDLSEFNDPDRAYTQSLDQISGFCDYVFKVPMFKHAKDALTATAVYKNGTLLGQLSNGDNPVVKSALIFNFEQETKRQKMSLTAFRKAGANALPVYEGSYIHQFDHRFAHAVGQVTRYLHRDEKLNPMFFIETLDFLPTDTVLRRLTVLTGKIPRWFVVLRRQAKGVNEFVSISTIIPTAASEGSLTAFFTDDAYLGASLSANFNSFAFNYIIKLRQAGFNLNKGVYESIPIVCTLSIIARLNAAFGPSGGLEWFSKRVLELTYTAWDLEAFAQDCGFTGPPFRWDEDRRFLLRCELDAAFFHLYLGPEEEWRKQPPALTQAFPTPRDAVSYIMDTFPIVKRKDEAAHNGAYRTKDTILRIYDALQTSILTSTPYQTLLSPPPADPSCCHPPRD